MSQSNEDNTKIDVTWHDFHRVLISLGYIPIPNSTPGKLTYFNEQKNRRFVLMKENGYNLDYFHAQLRQLNLGAQRFFIIAFRGRHASNK